MKYAIIAAGQGSRLTSEGVTTPKPLVKVQDEHLIDRLIRIFMLNDAEEIVVICNEESPLVEQHLRDLQTNGLHGQHVPLSHIVVKTTPSSMHSLYELSPFLKGSPFVATTVDTIFSEDNFHEFIQVAQGVQVGVMGVTDYVDDERPLYVKTRSQGVKESGSQEGMEEVTAFLDEKPETGLYHISAGVYALIPEALEVLKDCIERGESRMRNFQRALLRSGMKIKAKSLGKVFDIDHADDIRKAEAFLRAPRYWLVERRKGEGGRMKEEGREADRRLIEKVGRELDKCGYERVSGMKSVGGGRLPDVVLNMSRDDETLQQLKELEEKGCLIINKPQAVLGNTRERLHRLMLKHQLPAAPDYGHDGYWVKATCQDYLDRTVVEYFLTRDEADKRARQLEKEHFGKPVVTAHIKGDVIKFYGIGHDFFWTPLPVSSKEEAFLREEAQRLAEIMELDIYGGDAVISTDGRIYIIDFNDWPSFRMCQEEAARSIVREIIER